MCGKNFSIGEAPHIIQEVDSSKQVEWIVIEDIEAKLLYGSESANEEDSIKKKNDCEFW